MNDEIIDIHVHFGAPEDPDSGCYWSKEFENGIAFLAMRLVTNNLFGTLTIQRITKHLLRVINGSKHVSKTVLLGLDQVCDGSGSIVKDKTHLYVPNSFLAKFVSENDRVLFGASIHPYRNDWQEELQFCLDNKAVLCKWIPSSQQIDFTDPKCKLFYEKLAENNLPLLCHVGPEAAIPPFDKPHRS